MDEIVSYAVNCQDTEVALVETASEEQKFFMLVKYVKYRLPSSLSPFWFIVFLVEVEPVLLSVYPLNAKKPPLENYINFLKGNKESSKKVKLTLWGPDKLVKVFQEC